MNCSLLLRSFVNRRTVSWPRPAVWLALPLVLCGYRSTAGETPSASPKHIIGATATITEMSSGIAFAARVDTGAKSCSLHVEEIEIEDEVKRPADNVGKTIRFLVMNEKGESDWIETTVASVVRVRSAVFSDGEYDRRYKVRLTLGWGDGFRKEVLVTLNDRTHMTYPMLIGRNFLRGNFLVDVELDGHATPDAG